VGIFHRILQKTIDSKNRRGVRKTRTIREFLNIGKPKEERTRIYRQIRGAFREKPKEVINKSKQNIMKRLISLISSEGKTKKQLAKEIYLSVLNFKKAREKAKTEQLSSRKILLIPYSLSAEEALEVVKRTFKIGKK